MLFENLDIENGRVITKDWTDPNLTDKTKPDKLYTYQKNYDALPEINFQGLKIRIENPVGSIREGEGFKTKFFYPYGFIANSIEQGDDGDEIDVFIGNNPEAPNAYIINQFINGSYDEQKVILGADNEDIARDIYLSHYNTQEFLGPIAEVPIEEFKTFIGLTEE